MSNGLFVKWLTHDLATPIATVMTASELLGDQPDPEINGLVQEGAARLGARLRLIRTAFAPGNAPIAGPALARSSPMPSRARSTGNTRPPASMAPKPP